VCRCSKCYAATPFALSLNYSTGKKPSTDR
jgi:hypothetical protein